MFFTARINRPPLDRGGSASKKNGLAAPHHPSLPPPPLLPYASAAYDPPMQVQLSHPTRTVEIKGPKKVKDLLRELNLVVEAHLVIKGDDLVTEDEMLYEGDQIEVRPVISGG